MANAFLSSLAMSATSSMYPRSMSETLDMPMPSATSRMPATSSGSNSGDRGRPRITASGAAALRRVQPWRPPSLKSTNADVPEARESAEKRAMLADSSSSDASLR